MFLFEVGLDCLGAVEEETTLEGSTPGCANAFKDGANHCENDGSDYDRDLPIDQHKMGSYVLKVMTRLFDEVNLSLLLSCLELDFFACLFICVVVI